MKKNFWAILAMALVMLGLPWATVTFADHDAGMALCFILFFGVNPTVSMFVGVFAGLTPKQRWYLPILNAGAFLLGVWTVFDWGNPDFYGFAVSYLAVGLISMLAAAVVARNIRRELNNK